jgi:hypothetical protein
MPSVSAPSTLRSRLERVCTDGREAVYSDDAPTWASPPPMDHLPWDVADAHDIYPVSPLHAQGHYGSSSPQSQSQSPHAMQGPADLFPGLQAPHQHQHQHQQPFELMYTPIVPSQPEEPGAHAHAHTHNHTHTHTHTHTQGGPSRSHAHHPRDRDESPRRVRRAAHPADPPKPSMACLFCRGRKVRPRPRRVALGDRWLTPVSSLLSDRMRGAASW